MMSMDILVAFGWIEPGKYIRYLIGKTLFYSLYERVKWNIKNVINLLLIDFLSSQTFGVDFLVASPKFNIFVLPSFCFSCLVFMFGSFLSSVLVLFPN